MADVITSGEHVLTPTLLTQFASKRASRTVVHEIPGAEFPSVTLRAAGSREGSMTLGYEGPGSESDSAAAEALLSEGRVFTLTVDGRDTLALSFVVVGDVERELEDETRDAWLVRIGFREVSS